MVDRVFGEGVGSVSGLGAIYVLLAQAPAVFCSCKKGTLKWWILHLRCLLAINKRMVLFIKG